MLDTFTPLLYLNQHRIVTPNIARATSGHKSLKRSIAHNIARDKSKKEIHTSNRNFLDALLSPVEGVVFAALRLREPSMMWTCIRFQHFATCDAMDKRRLCTNASLMRPLKS